MDVILQPAISAYCEASAAERGGLIDQRTSGYRRPVSVLPLFEVCRTIHFGAKSQQFPPSEFRACWDTLALHLFGLSESGYPVHVTQSAEADWDTVIELLGFDPAPDVDMHDIVGEGFALAEQEPGMTRGFRALAEGAAREVLSWPEDSRGWRCNPPVEMPRRRFPAMREGDQTLVMDTCHLLDVLPELSLDGWDCNGLQLPLRLTRPAIRQYKAILSAHGLDGALIIPACAAEQTCRKALAQPQVHGKAGAVLEAIANNPEQPIWSAFRFDPLTQDVLDAFLHIHEKLSEADYDPTSWPHFSDALVLAHGLAHGYPVASNEWHETNEWKEVGKLFPHLDPGWTSRS